MGIQEIEGQMPLPIHRQAAIIHPLCARFVFHNPCSQTLPVRLHEHGNVQKEGEQGACQRAERGDRSVGRGSSLWQHDGDASVGLSPGLSLPAI